MGGEEPSVAGLEFSERSLVALDDAGERAARAFSLVPTLRVLHRHHVLVQHSTAHPVSEATVLD